MQISCSAWIDEIEKPVVKFFLMCGIVGYAGQKTDDRKYFAEDVVLEGLRRLEYRGYDSAGVAVYSMVRHPVA